MVGSSGGFVGRNGELARLVGVLREAIAGSGAAVLLEGEPGIGKSTLISTAVGAAAGELKASPEVVWIESSALSGRVPRSVAEWAARPVGDTRLARRRSVVAAMSELSEAARDQANTVEADLLRIARRVWAYEPVVAVFENLQDADETVVALWRRLITTTLHAPLALVGTRWPVPTSPALDRQRGELTSNGVLVLTLAPLPESDVVDLAGALLGARPGARFAEALAAAAGNPRYASEIVRAGVESGALAVDDDVIDLDGLPGPPTWVEADLGFLRPQTLEVLRRAATLEPLFSASDLALLSASSPMELIPAVDEASSAGLIEPAGPLLRFRHPVVRAGLRATIARADQIALHRRAAWMLVSARAHPRSVVQRLLCTRDAGLEPWAVDWLADNADALVRRTPAETAELLADAVSGLDLEVGDPRRAKLEDALAAAYIRLSRLDDGIRLAREIVDSDADAERVARNTFLLGLGLLLKLDGPEEMMRVLDRAIANPKTPALWRARCDALRSNGYALHGLYGDVREVAERALTEGRRLDDAMSIGHALHAKSVVAVVADQDTQAGASMLDEAFVRTRMDPALADLQTWLWGCHLNIGFEIGTPARELLDSGRRGLAVAAAAGSPYRGKLRADLAEVAYELGMWDEACAVLATEDELLAPATRHAISARIAMRRDRWTEAASSMSSLRDLSREPSTLPQLIAHRHILAARALACERNRSAEEAVGVLAEILEPGAEGRYLQRHRFLPALTRYALAARDRSTATAAARAAAADSRHEPLPGKLAADAWCRGLVRGNAADVVSAAELLRHSEAMASLGNALEDAAVLYAEAGETQAARRTLSEALEVYAVLGAAWDTRRAAARLRPHGIRLTAHDRRRADGGESHTLTAGELRVAELVAKGYSNPEIADRLSLSPRTVQSHVSRILAKLGVNSRHEVRIHLAP